MKNLLFLFIIIVLSFSCSNEIIQPDSTSFGKISLKIDRENAPESVTLVKAYLTRENYQPIVATLNLLSDSTAEILINEISVGNWNLKVDAENDSGLVLYTGEAEVQILAGFTTQVYLTLQPTGFGTGSIYIHVGWGVPTGFAWQDYPYNPLIFSSNSYYDYYGVAQPVVLYEDSTYKMWYVGLGSAGSGQSFVMYAESNDGIFWNKYPGPVLSPGTYGTWDSQNVQPCAIIRDNGTYKLYYTGFSSVSYSWSIGLATSLDGITWEKQPDPILNPSSQWEYQMIASSVVFKNGTYYLFYTGRDYPYYAVGLAISSDGTNFTKYSGNPILTSTAAWEGNGVLDANVILEGTGFKMIYMNAASSGFGFANSQDGYNWSKSSSNPFITNLNTANDWAKGKISYPYWCKVGNDTRIYYSGTSLYSDEHRIGMMRKVGN